MTMETALLTLDTLAKYLRDKEVQLDIEDQGGQRFIRMGWRFEMGDAAVLVSVNDGPNNTSAWGASVSRTSCWSPKMGTRC